VDRLYLAGPSSNPGGGVYGAGRATAIRMFEQLGMDFSLRCRGRTAGHRCSNIGIDSPNSRDGTARPADEELMNVESLERKGDELIIKGTSFGTMPMEARLDGPSARAGLKMLGWGILLS